jgi:hypothetical protein
MFNVPVKRLDRCAWSECPCPQTAEFKRTANNLTTASQYRTIHVELLELLPSIHEVRPFNTGNWRLTLRIENDLWRRRLERFTDGEVAWSK